MEQHYVTCHSMYTWFLGWRPAQPESTPPAAFQSVQRFSTAIYDRKTDRQTDRQTALQQQQQSASYAMRSDAA